MKKAAEYIIAIFTLIALTVGGLTYFATAEELKVHAEYEQEQRVSEHKSFMELIKEDRIERIEADIRKLTRTPLDARDAFHNDDLVGLQNRKARLLR